MNVRRVASVAGDGNRRATLEAMRNKLAAELDGEKGSYAAAVSRELRQVLSELDELGDANAHSAVDDLEMKRATRRANAANS